MSTGPTFDVTLHQLTPEAKHADSGAPDLELLALNEKKLRELIRSLAKLAPTNLGGASPELRVTAPHGQFVVQIAQGRLRINSWTIKVGGADLSPEQVFALITGTEAVADAVGLELNGRPKRSRGATIALLAALILGSNATTAWLLTRPSGPPPLLPDYTPLAAEPATRFVSGLVGEYRSGATAGARALKISADGHVHWLVLGDGGAIAEDAELAVQPVQSHGQPALLADGRALIEAPDAASLVFYRETYRRETP
jgi:hypothetical protein